MIFSIYLTSLAFPGKFISDLDKCTLCQLYDQLVLIFFQPLNSDQIIWRVEEIFAPESVIGDIVVGGTDTTETMAEWVMAEMMCNPEVMKKAQEELAEVVGMNNIVEEAHLPKLLTVFGCSCEGDIPSTRASPTPSPTVS
ncbi:hypothetical protein L1049_006314 [Liquidambar formosana]|uniref:Cytochrome P450 n=1 Tax=Liquidambar formosana TaxID=63359 RepID=A0AAP0RH51_LIQFO